MPIGGIDGGKNNPFLEKYLDGADFGAKDSGTDKLSVGSPEKTDRPDGVKKTGMEEGAGSNNTNANPNAVINRDDFTKDDDLQEIDMEEFEDDFR